MLTMTSSSYDNNQRFIERFDLDLVTLKGNNLPSWFSEHLTMLVRTANDSFSVVLKLHLVCGHFVYCL